MRAVCWEAAYFGVEKARACDLFRLVFVDLVGGGSWETYPYAFFCIIAVIAEP